MCGCHSCVTKFRIWRLEIWNPNVGAILQKQTNMRSSGNRTEQHVPTATVVDDEAALIVDEETLRKAKNAADEELRKRKEAATKNNDEILNNLRRKLERETDSVRENLKSIEVVEMAAQSLAMKNAEFERVRQFEHILQQVAETDAREKFESAERIDNLVQQELATHHSWCASHPTWERIANERDETLARHQQELKHMRGDIEKERKRFQRQWEVEKQELQEETGKLGANRQRNLLFGIVVGAITGYLVDLARL